MRNGNATLVALRQAIHNEIAGQRFYNEAALYCVDPWAKEVFATLAREEENHTRLLLVEYEALSSQGRWIDPEVAMTSNAEVDITALTFPEDGFEELFPLEWTADRAIDRRVDDLDALAFGIEMEKEAIRFYAEAANSVADPGAHLAYEFLIEEERRHYQQFKDQWERLAGITFEGA